MDLFEQWIEGVDFSWGFGEIEGVDFCGQRYDLVFDVVVLMSTSLRNRDGPGLQSLGG
jgi:hypothetical protein